MQSTKPKLAIVGGTGALGSGFARRLAAAGYEIVIGSRTDEKAQEAANQIPTAPGGVRPRGATNAEASQAADVVLVTVPFGSQAQILDEIKPHVAGKLVIDATVPLVPPKVARVQLPAEALPPPRLSNVSVMASGSYRHFTMSPRTSYRPTSRSNATCWFSAMIPKTGRSSSRLPKLRGCADFTVDHWSIRPQQKH